MKIQTRLSLISSITFGIIFAIISVLIYGLYYKNTEKSIYTNLEKTSLTTAIFYLEEDELNKEDFDNIKNQFKESVINTYYQIYDGNNNIRWGAEAPLVRSEILEEIRANGSMAFYNNDKEYMCYGIFYEDNQGDFVVITKEKRSVLTAQMKTLLWILVIAFVGGILAIVLISKWMASYAYRPFSKVISQVQKISTSNLDIQIESPNTNDELQDLIETFNDLLTKISETFVIQKNFVSYVSHEFKTPLTSMLGNLEVFSIKDRTPEEYKLLSQKLVDQIYQLEEILDTLITISDLRKDSNIDLQIRIDELIWEILNKINERYPNAKVMVNVDIIPGDEKLLSVSNDSTQLLIALYNLIENAVKYSQGNVVDINIYRSGNRLILSIADTGIGIPEDQLTSISKPFYRADNANKIQGSGIGLSIALRILEKNNIKYEIKSKINEGTIVFLNFN